LIGSIKRLSVESNRNYKSNGHKCSGDCIDSCHWGEKIQKESVLINAYCRGRCTQRNLGCNFTDDCKSFGPVGSIAHIGNNGAR
jgi:hypothetical protein